MVIITYLSHILNKVISIRVFSNLLTYYPKIRNPLYLKYYIKKLKRILNSNSLEKLVDFILLGNHLIDFLFLGKGIVYTQQIKTEIFTLLKILQKRKPKRILEIGTAGGGSLILISKVSTKDSTIISVDLPGGIHGGGYPAWKKVLYKSCCLPTQNLHLIRANSHEISTFNIVKNLLNGYKLDFLLIDGDHTYKGVKRDFELYRTLIDDEGIIAFHDIVEHPAELNCDVFKFWREIKEDYKYQEIIDSKDQKWAGFGLLYQNNSM